MYRVIGLLVVAGFALFGVSKFVEDHVVLGEEGPDELEEGKGERGVNTPSVAANKDSAILNPA